MQRVYWGIARHFARIATLSIAAAVAAGCAHTRTDDSSWSGPSADPVGVDVASTTSDSSTAPASPALPNADEPVVATPADLPAIATADAARGATVAGLTPDQYPDLFDRMRSGFQLRDENRRAIDQQLSYYANNPAYLERVFGRAELYLHHIVQEVEARGMPLEIALLPVVESAFEPYAMSSARAYGMWQFMPGTAQRFGLKQNWWYDGRRDVVASTRAALDFLQYMHDEYFGDWLLAIAGYNCGEGCVQRAVRANRAAGLPVDFWNLKLPAETRAYVPKLMAMARLVRNPDAYGIEFSSIPNEPYFVRVDTGGQVDMSLAADLAGITDEELYELNPGFHRWASAPSGPHYLLIPEESADAFREGLALLTPDERLRVTIHKVQPGESIASIATRYKTQPTVVRELNSINGNSLVVGSELRVPSGVTELPPKVMRAAARIDRGGSSMRTGGKRPAIHVVRRGDSLWRIARRHKTDVRTLARLNNIGPGAKLRAGQKLVVSTRGGDSTVAAARSSGTSKSSSGARKVTYKVRRGDTLSHIARLFDVTVADIASWNSITPRTTIKPGQRITVQVKRR